MSEKIYNFTVSLEGTVQYGRTAATTVFLNRLTSDRLQRISEIRLSPHGLTHMDLPRCIFCKEQRDDITDHKLNSVNYGLNRTVPCVIVNLRHKAKSMKSKISLIKSQAKLLLPIIFWKLDEYKSELKNLRITKSDLELLNIPKEHFVIFYTGWREFIPKDGDLRNPLWNGWHPFLMNPYLDESAIKYLLDDLKVTGMGCDTYSIDFPLRFLSDKLEDNRYHLPEILRDALKDDELKPSSIKDHDLCYCPVHFHLLSRQLLLIENLAITIYDQIKMEPDEENKAYICSIGTFTWLPFRHRDSREALLGIALYTPTLRG